MFSSCLYNSCRLVYQSRKRGMLENDLLLSTFIAKYLDRFTDKQLEQYDRQVLLECFYWLVFDLEKWIRWYGGNGSVRIASFLKF